MDVDRSLPGADLIDAGLRDLGEGLASIPALIVSIGAPRLRSAGISVEGAHTDPEHRLYDLLAQANPDDAHARYNALIRLLVSFERALECVA